MGEESGRVAKVSRPGGRCSEPPRNATRVKRPGVVVNPNGLDVVWRWRKLTEFPTRRLERMAQPVFLHEFSSATAQYASVRRHTSIHDKTTQSKRGVDGVGSWRDVSSSAFYWPLGLSFRLGTRLRCVLFFWVVTFASEAKP